MVHLVDIIYNISNRHTKNK